jgi:ABC-type branched-subunit amino acid transport system substrate-binding protein
MAHSKLTRRDVVKGSAAAGLAGLAGLAGCTGGGGGEEGAESEFPALGNYPVEGDTVTFGFNVPQTGSYSQEGKDELDGYNLAKQHLNNGGGWVDQWDDLSGDGVLGYTVESVDGDTATDPDAARQSASRMISRDEAIMVSGGSSSSVAIAVQELCQTEKVQFMSCLTHSNDTTGKECARYGFRELFNAYNTGAALAPVLTDEYGENQNFYILYADYTWGQTVQSSMTQFLEEAGHNLVESVPTPLGTSDYSSYLSNVPTEEVDMLILSHYGLDAANSLPQARDAGLDQDMELVVPLYNRLMARAASDSIDGVFGTADWNWQLEDEFSTSFTDAFESEYGEVPSYAARLAYLATLQYAAAAERTGTFYPPEVIRELEDYEYDNAGLGPETLRGCDHQAQRPVLVVRGAPAAEQTEQKLLNISSTTPTEDVAYACDEGPAAECELGPYGDE